MDIAAAVENAIDRHGIGIDVEGDRYSPLESDYAQAGSKIVASCPALSGVSKSQAISFDSVDDPMASAKPDLEPI
jgi:hypothetical protein